MKMKIVISGFGFFHFKSPDKVLLANSFVCMIAGFFPFILLVIGNADDISHESAGKNILFWIKLKCIRLLDYSLFLRSLNQDNVR